MTEMTKGIKMLSALLGEEGGGPDLLDATRNMMMAFKDLLNAASPEAEEVCHFVSMSCLVNSCYQRRIGSCRIHLT